MTIHDAERTVALAGLSEAEAKRRLEARGPAAPPATSRSYASIVRANVLTVFNLILVVFGVVTLVFGDWRDALFLAILVANSGIGIAQEVRAKRALDRLAALVAPDARVVRDGEPRRVAVEEVVEGDLLLLAPGDQVVADGRLERSDGLALDESILTGESRPAVRRAGEEVRSGSFAVEGAGAFEVTAVGRESYAERIAGEAREFRHPRSPLERALNRLLVALVVVLVPLGVILGYALWEREAPLDEAVSTSVAAVVTLVPEGLILLASLTYAVAAARMARRGALAQQLNAIESLASVEVICLDKTGTLTEPSLRVVALLPAPGSGEPELAAALGRYAASTPAWNTTLETIAEAYPGPAADVAAHVPFSSGRRWSGLQLGDTSYVLGAPELFPLGGLDEAARAHAAAGRRVLAFGTTLAGLGAAEPDSRPPGEVRLAGLVVLAERLRPDTRSTVAFLLAQGIELKVLSGDAPETVGAIAADAGIPAGVPPLDGRELPSAPAALLEAVRGAAVIGRIAPEGKRRIVEALAAEGRYVAMIGDGVNDVPALKAARLAIAQGSGAQMARAVADLVLVRGDFAAVPAMIGEGRKILRNLQRVSKLFVAKSAFAAFLILTIGIGPTAYPLLPRQLTLAATLAIGVPSFFLALAPSAGAWRPHGFLRDVARFAVPAGTFTGIGVVASYQFALHALDLPLLEARTVATTVLVAVGLYLILALEAAGRLRGAAVGALCAALAALYGLALALPETREFFELAVPGAAAVAVSVGGIALAIAGLALTADRFLPGRAFSSGPG